MLHLLVMKDGMFLVLSQKHIYRLRSCRIPRLVQVAKINRVHLDFRTFYWMEFRIIFLNNQDIIIKDCLTFVRNFTFVSITIHNFISMVALFCFSLIVVGECMGALGSTCTPHILYWG